MPNAKSKMVSKRAPSQAKILSNNATQVERSEKPAAKTHKRSRSGTAAVSLISLFYVGTDICKAALRADYGGRSATKGTLPAGLAQTYA